MVINRGAL